jgi:hypothetical protein
VKVTAPPIKKMEVRNSRGFSFEVKTRLEASGGKKDVRPCICLYIDSIFTWIVTRPCGCPKGQVEKYVNVEACLLSKIYKTPPFSRLLSVNLVHTMSNVAIISKAISLSNIFRNADFYLSFTVLFLVSCPKGQVEKYVNVEACLLSIYNTHTGWFLFSVTFIQSLYTRYT